MKAEDWSNEASLFRSRGLEITPGLTGAELERVERTHDFRFPPDLRSMLESFVPFGQRCPDWRNPQSSALADQFARPFEGMAFDIEHNGFWLPGWGARPALLADALAIAKAAVADAPRLIPICGHRYLPAEPAIAGNPVFSVHQTDIIHYGADLRRYIACDFGQLSYTDATLGEIRRIRFWTDVLEANE